MGCKFFLPLTAAERINGINRYIVGCKLAYTNKAGAVNKRINRYIVGCKYGNSDGTHTRM